MAKPIIYMCEYNSKFTYLDILTVHFVDKKNNFLQTMLTLGGQILIYLRRIALS